MTPFDIKIPRHKIADSFSRWTALSALRSGSPLKSKEDVYRLLNSIDLNYVLAGRAPISKASFEKWHQDALLTIRRRSRNKLPIGWTAKIVNVYLKSMTYLSGIGRPNLVKYIHPPIDSGLWNGLKDFCKDHAEIRSNVYYKTRIKDITRLDDYQKIINGCRQVAKEEAFLLIEVEKYWLGADLKEKKTATLSSQRRASS